MYILIIFALKFFPVCLKLQLIQQWYTVVLPGACLDLGLMYGVLNSIFYYTLCRNLLHCQNIVYSDLSLWGITLHGALYMSPGFIIITSLLIFHRFIHFVIKSSSISFCFNGPFLFSQYSICSIMYHHVFLAYISLFITFHIFVMFHFVCDCLIIIVIFGGHLIIITII